MLYADVIIPLALPQLYSYEVPEEFAQEIAVGSRVLVQIGKKKLYAAIVYNLHKKKPQLYETKPIESILDARPIVTYQQLQLWQWIASYYMCSMGEVMKAALPSGLKLESSSYIYTNNSLHVDASELSDIELAIIHIITENQGLRLDELQKQFATTEATKATDSLLKKNLLITGEKVIHTYKEKTETHIRLTQSIDNEEFCNKAFELVAKAPKQEQLLSEIIHLSTLSKKEDFSITKKKLLQIAASSASILNELIKKEIVEEFSVAISRLDTDTAHETQAIKSLSQPQTKALQQIKESFNTYNTTLLHGVTASGKTEVYIHLIAEMLQQGKQVLYLLPEIALTSQIITRLQKVFGNKVGVYHSKFSDNERIEVWKNLLDHTPESYSIILGVRSSIFLPFNNLGLIIVDEEHESSLKQYDPAPRYHARDTAILLAQLHNAKTLLGSATPSIETFANVMINKFAKVELLERFSSVMLPHIATIDLPKARKQKQMYNSMFSKELIKAMQETLEKKQQIILFQNRRGYSATIQCTDCGHSMKCKHCDVTLTYHKAQHTQRCHYCGYSIKHTNACQACGSGKLDYIGIGTEQIQESLQEIFPNYKTARMDLDTTKGKHAFRDIIQSFELREVDILVGTQMVTKGLDFDNVGLVAIIYADSMLNYPDFRSHERSFQMMVQVAGRAGRSNKQGSVLIQTNDAKNPVYKFIKTHDFNSFFQEELRERQTFLYPPFSRIIKIIVRHKEKHICERAAHIFAEEIKLATAAHSLLILGPEYPLIARTFTYYIQEMLIKIPRAVQPNTIKHLLFQAALQASNHKEFRSSQWHANVDPY